MNLNKLLILIAAVSLVLLSQCKKDDNEAICTEDLADSRFNFSAFPLPELSDYGFFEGDMKEQLPAEGFLPYEVITPLFSDYAHKHRFIWMPEGEKALYNTDHEVLDMPNGTIIIKSFYYDNVLPSNTTQLVETRLLYKLEGEWNFADYIWNEEQTEAFFDLDGAYKDISFLNDEGEQVDVEYRIPSEVECFTCHKLTNDALPIGPKPQNLNKDMVYTDGEFNQLQKWIDEGLLDSNIPAQIETVADWSDSSIPELDRVRAYLDMNCAHCHRETSHCSYRDMRFAWNETELLENTGACVEPAEPIAPNQLYVVAPGNASKSMLYYRINNVEPSERMPLMGRTIIHEEGVELIKNWINNLEITCE